MYIITTSNIVAIDSLGVKMTALLKGRKYIQLQNVGEYTVWVAGTAVTADTAGTGGHTLYPFATWRENYSHLVDVYCIVKNTGGSVLQQEGK